MQSRPLPTRLHPPTPVAIIPTGAMFPCLGKRSISVLSVPSLPFPLTRGRSWSPFNGHATTLMRFATISKATFWKRLNSVLLILPHDYERVDRPNDSLGPQTFPTFSVAPTVLVGHWPETQVIAKILF